MAGVGLCHAQSFSALLELARSSEPTYLGVKTNVQAAHARTVQAIGAMLPQVTATASTHSNMRDYETRGTTFSAERDRFNSNSAQINLTQPILRYANIVAWQQAEAVAAQAQHQLAGAEFDLVGKLATAWLDVLAARDGVLFADRQAAAVRRQWEVIRRGVELGANSPPQLEEAKTKYDQAMADAVAAQTEAQLKQAALEQLVGPLRQSASPVMRENAILADLNKEKLETWLAAAEADNPSILGALKAYEAADAEMRKQFAGHQPTLDLVLSHNRNRQAVGGFPGQAGYDTRQNSAGLQLTIPILSSGTQSAKVDEAAAQKEKARLEIEAARRAVALAVKQAWFGWQTAYARARAGEQTMNSARVAVESARRGSDNGLKTELDILQAELQGYAAQRDFRKGRYDQVAAYVKLKAAAATLSPGDVEALNSLFIAAPENIGSMAHRAISIESVQ